MSVRNLRTLAAILAFSAFNGPLAVMPASAGAAADQAASRHKSAPFSRPDRAGPQGGHSSGLRIRPQSYIPAPAVLQAPPNAAFSVTPRCVSGPPLGDGNCPRSYAAGPPRGIDNAPPSIGGPWPAWQGLGPGYFGRAPGVPAILPPQPPLLPRVGLPSSPGSAIYAPRFGAPGVGPPRALAH